ncbi:hypothetical protein FRC08_013512, partial [Ceratobasidium sp. 394]
DYLPPRSIVIASNCRVTVPDEQKPNSRDSYFLLIESRGVSIPVYVYMAGPGLFQHDFALGKFLPLEAPTDEFKLPNLAGASFSKQLLPSPASILAVGEITTTNLNQKQESVPRQVASSF